MGRKKGVISKKERDRFNYYKNKGYDVKASSILAISPKYVRKDFRDVKRIHGKKHAISWLKGKHGR